MGNARPIRLKFLVVAVLLAATSLVLSLSGLRLPVILLIVTILAVLLWWFIRRPRSEGELPSAAVSCCHYLGDQEKERPQPPQ